MSEQRGNYFVALPLVHLPRHAIVSAAMARWQALAPGMVRSVSPANYHVTLIYLADLPQQALSTLSAWLAEQARAWSPMLLHLQQLRAFPDAAGKYLVWGFQPNSALLARQAALTRFCQEQNWPVDQRVFRPHVTVARVLQPQALLAAPLSPVLALPWVSRQIGVFESIASAIGQQYRLLSRHDLY